MSNQGLFVIVPRMGEMRRVNRTDDNGNPIVVYENEVELMTPAARAAAKARAWAMPYVPQQDHSPDCHAEGPCSCPVMAGEWRFEGMNLSEAAEYRQAIMGGWGNTESFKNMEDRTLGKPKQQIEQTTTITTIWGLLEDISKREAENPTPEIIDVTVMATKSKLLEGL